MLRLVSLCKHMTQPGSAPLEIAPAATHAPESAMAAIQALCDTLHADDVQLRPLQDEDTAAWVMRCATQMHAL